MFNKQRKEWKSNNNFFLNNFLKSAVNRKEPEQEFIISAPGGNLISASRLRIHNTEGTEYTNTLNSKMLQI